MEKMYFCIDMKSFFASVECAERGLDPFKTDLVVADISRTEKTICLAVTPSLKKKGVKNRCRMFEIPKNLKYITAPPRMRLYMDYAAEIYAIYLRYFSKDDIFVYSIDEAFIDVTGYDTFYGKTYRELALKVMSDIKNSLGIPSTCGMGTNLYLAKIALDIISKHCSDNVGYLDEVSFREKMWDHVPLTDFWGIGVKTAERLAHYGITTQREIACFPEAVLYKIFGKDAEIMIDHSKGIEPVTMKDIKNYKASTHSLVKGQVLKTDYTKKDGLVILKEMTEELIFELYEKDLYAKSVTLCAFGRGDSYRATANFQGLTHSYGKIMSKTSALYEKTLPTGAFVKRISISMNDLNEQKCFQLDFFSTESEEKEDRRVAAIGNIKRRYGVNSLFMCRDLCENATLLERNFQIGGHRSGCEGKSKNICTVFGSDGTL